MAIHPIVYNDDRMDHIEKIKVDSYKMDFPPSFFKDYSFYSKKYPSYDEDCYEFNCYAYALQLKILRSEIEIRMNGENIYPDSRGTSIYTPGYISGLKQTKLFNTDDLLKLVVADCEVLDIDASEVGFYYIPRKNEYKIAFYAWYDYDYGRIGYHFLRQNKLGIWSSKIGWYEGVFRGFYIPQELDIAKKDAKVLRLTKKCDI